MLAEVSRQRRIAVALMLVSSALMAITSLLAKILGNPLGAAEALHPFQITAGRFAFALATVSLVAICRPPPMQNIAWRFHIGRSSCGFAGVTLLFAAAASMPLADATAVSFLSPIFTMLFAVLFLAESLRVRQILCVAIAFAGTLVLVRPGMESFQPAAILALGSAVFLGLEAIFIKRLSDGEPALRILLINNVIGCLLAAIAAWFVWKAPDRTQWVFLVALGVTMAGVQSLFIQAMKRAPATRIIPFFYATLAFAALYDWLIFSVALTPFALVGISLIVGALLGLNIPVKAEEADATTAARQS